MRRYLIQCRDAIQEKLLEINIGPKQHLILYPEMYSIADLISIENGTMKDVLNKSYNVFENHIRNCEICCGKGYCCEICGNREIIFPFDDAALPCKVCNTIYHRVCWIRKNSICVKCIRYEKRKVEQETSFDIGENECNDEKSNSSSDVKPGSSRDIL